MCREVLLIYLAWPRYVSIPEGMFLSCSWFHSSSSTLPAWVTLPEAEASAGFALRVIGPTRLSHRVEVATQERVEQDLVTRTLTVLGAIAIALIYTFW